MRFIRNIFETFFKEFRKKLMEKNEENFDDIKYRKKSIIEKKIY